MGRYFTLAQAESLVILLEEELRQAVQLRQEHLRENTELNRMTQRLMLMGGMVANQEEFLASRARLHALAARLQESLETLQGHGCLVKDLDSGLLDFPTLFRGEEVYLCWRLGEPSITHWHRTEEGFKGRKPIDRDFLEHHQGDPIH